MPTVSRGLFRWLFCHGATLEDFADRLNHVWTFGLLLLLACILSWRHHAKSPIHCFFPAEFTTEQAIYFEKHCWGSHSIIYPSLNDSIDESAIPGPDYFKMPYVSFGDDDITSSGIRNVTLYQWLPLIFCFQALLFKMPAILMYLLHGYSGISFEKIFSLTEGYSNLNMADRQLLGRQTGRYIYNWCFQFKCLPWRLLTMVWLLVKILFAVNIIIQFHVLNKYLAMTSPRVTNSTSYGDAITDNIFTNNATLWSKSRVFPRQIMCQVPIRRFINTYVHELQCDLPANELNETICMFLWVWFSFVTMVTLGSLAVWLLTTLLPIGRKRFISKVLFLSDEINPTLVADHSLSSFSSLVGEDGVMALKLIGANSSDHVVGDAVSAMWNLNMLEERGQAYHPVEASRL